MCQREEANNNKCYTGCLSGRKVPIPIPANGIVEVSLQPQQEQTSPPQQLQCQTSKTHKEGTGTVAAHWIQ